MNINTTNLGTGFIGGFKPVNHSIEKSIPRSVIKNLMERCLNRSEKKVEEAASEYLNMDNGASETKTPEDMSTKIDRSKVTVVRHAIPSNAYPELVGKINLSLTEPLLYGEKFYKFKQIRISK